MFRTVIIISLASAALVGCAQDSTDAAAYDRSAQIDIPPSTQLNQLTADQRVEVCEATKHTISPDLKCQVESTTWETSHATCERAKAACLADQGQNVESDCAFVTAEPIECDVTIELVQNCLDEQIVAFPQAFSDVTCENADAVDFATMVDGVVSVKQMTPSCQRLESLCPSFIGNEM